MSIECQFHFFLHVTRFNTRKIFQLVEAQAQSAAPPTSLPPRGICGRSTSSNGSCISRTIYRVGTFSSVCKSEDLAHKMYTWQSAPSLLAFTVASQAATEDSSQEIDSKRRSAQGAEDAQRMTV